MLMMLVVFWGGGQVRAADAHDAGGLAGFG